MNAVEIEEAVGELVAAPFDANEFPFAFLAAFGNPETTIKRLRKGGTNRSDVPGAVLQRSNIHILVTPEGGVEDGLNALRESPRTAQQKAKFVLATDGEELQAEELTMGEVLVCQLSDLPKHFGFLLPLAGISTVEEIKNNPIDIKATGRLDKLYVALLEHNPDWATQANRADFNHFMAQLIFCFFAEDTGIFNGDDLFTAAVRQMSESDGSNTREIITNIFEAMNRDPRKGERNGVRPYADVFPFVNGGLFGGDVKVPEFSRIARTYLLRAGELDWTAINPDIFGSMIQAVADDDERGELGMHYTSVPNILKVLNPLFLDSLNADLERAGTNKQQLGKLKKRLSRIRVFDPACGSGNFLVIAYKRMREIEHRANEAAGWGEPGTNDEGNPRWVSERSVIPLTNFRGIEIKSFAAEIARLALIIAEYQCDELYMSQREALALFLPLEKQNWIVCENALRVDWLKICPPPGETQVGVKLTEDDLFRTPKEQSEIDFENEGGETYICGNPPYLGSQWRSAEQQLEMRDTFSPLTTTYRDLDYVACWYLKSAQYCSATKAGSALVATKTICQGIQVAMLWPLIFDMSLNITFAHRPFTWRNSAQGNAGVTCVIVGFSQDGPEKRPIYDGSSVVWAKNIGPYLLDMPNLVVRKSNIAISELPRMDYGNKPSDGGNLILEQEEARDLVSQDRNASIYIKKYIGSKEFVNSTHRHCIWVDHVDAVSARSVVQIDARVEKVRRVRASSKGKQSNDNAETPYRFVFAPHRDGWALVIPRVSSENRPYLPVGFVDGSYIIADTAAALYDAEPWHMALIASRLHHQWIANVCVRLRTDFRYSNTLGWNTFPVPPLTQGNKDALTRTAENILLAREAHFPASIADLYKPDAMPENLRAAHAENDRVLEEIYIGRRFRNDTERLEKLFAMYTAMTRKAA